MPFPDQLLGDTGKIWVNQNSRGPTSGSHREVLGEPELKGANFWAPTSRAGLLLRLLLLQKRRTRRAA